MFISTRFSIGGSQRFFYLTFRDGSLRAYYNNMFTLTHQYKYTLTELENMLPWERDMYIAMVNNWVKEETDRINKTKVESQETMKKLLKPKKR